MFLKAKDSRIRYTGRWNVGEKEAVSTANGNYLEFVFCGETAVMQFNVEDYAVPGPHVYVAVDGGARIEVPLEKFIRISTEEGEHRVQVILKGSVESQTRWVAPIQSKVALVDIQAEDFAQLPADHRKTIEFLGDSITEGISIDVEPQFVRYGGNKDMVYWDDSTAGYAWLTAKALDFRPIIMGYGCLGTTHGGAGGIPPVCEAYSLYSDGFPMESAQADIIVINHGTNDRRSDPQVFQEKYLELLRLVRARNPHAKIVALTPFCGALAKEIAQVVASFNAQEQDAVFYIDTTGWISPEPLHPDREGHKTVSRNLVRLIRENLL